MLLLSQQTKQTDPVIVFSNYNTESCAVWDQCMVQFWFLLCISLKIVGQMLESSCQIVYTENISFSFQTEGLESHRLD